MTTTDWSSVEANLKQQTFIDKYKLVLHLVKRLEMDFRISMGPNGEDKRLGMTQSKFLYNLELEYINVILNNLSQSLN